MTNPFEQEDSMYLVLVNAENQHSLWPAWIDVPAGWKPVHGSASRPECIDYVNKSWTDMRPLSLVVKMEGERVRRHETYGIRLQRDADHNLLLGTN